MLRRPFVWEVQVRRELLDDELAQLRQVPYTAWRDVVLRPISKSVTARDGRAYRLTITAEYRGADVHVTMVLAHARGFRRRLLRQTFTISPDNVFRA